MELKNNPVVARVPYLNAVNSLTKKKYDTVEDKHFEQCAICLNDYKETDEVAELKCDKRHYFHSQCLEVWMKRKLECPICRTPV
jgi:hypothetical protein